MDGHTDHKGARTKEDQKGGPSRDYSIIRGTLLRTHATLTNLPSGTGCLAASSTPYCRHINGHAGNDWSQRHPQLRTTEARQKENPHEAIGGAKQ